MRNPADAEDVTQTTFLNAYRAYVEKGDRPQKPQNWLIAIAHNVCRQRFRQSRAALPRSPSRTTSPTRSPTTRRRPAEDIRRALGHLAFNQRAALVMRELEGRSYAEIAEILERLDERGGDTHLPRAPCAARAARGLAHVRRSRARDLAPARRAPAAGGAGPAARASARVRRMCEASPGASARQRSALKSLALIPVPTSLTSLFGGGGAAVGTGLALKAAAAVTAGLVIGGGTYEGVRHAPWRGWDAGRCRAEGGVRRSRGEAVCGSASRLPEDLTRPAKTPSPKQRGANRKGGSLSGRTSRKAKKPKKKAKSGHASGRGQGKARYAGDASVSARHVKVRQVAGPGASRKAAKGPARRQVEAHQADWSVRHQGTFRQEAVVEPRGRREKATRGSRVLPILASFPTEGLGRLGQRKESRWGSSTGATPFSAGALEGREKVAKRKAERPCRGSGETSGLNRRPRSPRSRRGRGSALVFWRKESDDTSTSDP